MDGIISRLDFRGGFAEFTEHLRTGEEFYAKTEEELLKVAAYILKKMDGELPRLFKTLPRMPYGIRTVPDYMAPRTTTAYYWPPKGDGTDAGYYYVNVYDLKSRPIHEMETLSFHEAVPGHHLQIALQHELENLPNFRRFGGFTAFVEGWALYAEKLGFEVGFYKDPYQHFGHLIHEIWRACRLVVDTGIHCFGWPREKAVPVHEGEHGSDDAEHQQRGGPLYRVAGARRLHTRSASSRSSSCAHRRRRRLETNSTCGNSTTLFCWMERFLSMCSRRK